MYKEVGNIIGPVKSKQGFVRSTWLKIELL